MHEGPQVPNYGKPGSGMPLKAGMTIAIEPMVLVGTAKHTFCQINGRWYLQTDH